MIERRNIFLVGPMGAGKSTVGRQLAKKLNMDFFDSDQEIEKRTGVNIEWIFDLEGEAGFRRREKQVIDELTEKYGIILATGGGSVKLKENRSRLSARGTVVYLEATVERQISRIYHDKRRPLIESKEKILETLKTLANERDPLYREIADIVIKVNDKSANFLVRNIINLL
ncbi:shikimate kinase AroK [Candidatus Riesia pediculischaeffi]|uniref:Shikimate kinase 1 n=2 Tax=Candidatus Riesia pediculischaeffi TaxID=428411 RepID=A0A1V0HJZ8_9ENTR|nr:shikimate kinase AroK [Candidatus Riesia pediculischaeffi]ARC53150.1 shikimate kinase [Candidatus Riesia pediculischaeffi]KIE64223.1 Shikimate kinase I [Candidatus Riesia pediculischaeffi PTSU]